MINPLLHLVDSNMQSFREAVWCEPISPSLRAFPQTVQWIRPEFQQFVQPSIK
jgi:hypothetical protein